MEPTKKGTRGPQSKSASPRQGAAVPSVKPNSPRQSSSQCNKETPKYAPRPTLTNTTTNRAARTADRSPPVQPARTLTSNRPLKSVPPQPFKKEVDSAKYTVHPRVQKAEGGARAVSPEHQSDNSKTLAADTAKDGTLPTGMEATLIPHPLHPSIPASYTSRKLDKEKLSAIERDTRGQRNNPKWFEWRQNRITASNAHKIANSRFVNGISDEVPQSYLRAVVSSGSNVKTPAMTWGINNESVAVNHYQKLKSKQLGKDVVVEDCGLFIHPEHNWLAASPDGIVRDSQSKQILNCLEVKCPFKHRNNTISKACTDKTFCLEQAGSSSYSLKKKHDYYTQVQCQLAVTGLTKADFIVYTSKDMAVVPVEYDPIFWKQTATKLEMFYTQAVLPQLKAQRREE
ncbi:uncharacterized protein LOC120536601 [Polypterus senegalus]|uniref:uncharacterized protein LOC120536601 n=1 Tax=Polypterus senegalus TaxID=55291 RepID=UPI0019641E1B|nr:uncharacterized protein LOC120536601 [Polypterus senegalus]